MLRRVISGGQTGVDQAAWRAARSAGLETGGQMPRGFATEDGPRPDFASSYGATANESDDAADRTVANAAVADATLILLDGSPGPGTALTIETCRRLNRIHRVVTLADDPADVALWIMEQGGATLNVAGDRESTAPGIGGRAEAFLGAIFRECCGTREAPLH
jgi:hypothetical protein